MTSQIEHFHEWNRPKNLLERLLFVLLPTAGVTFGIIFWPYTGYPIIGLVGVLIGVVALAIAGLYGWRRHFSTR
ncbi:hypothetical protein [Candidatus Poriferisodalis sp.]|uniref:hypothetical protein n=1 Tax=Candidatus Poriferisodalis sp. TaxID=3101277 RepID=UPI003B025B5D